MARKSPLEGYENTIRKLSEDGYTRSQILGRIEKDVPGISFVALKRFMQNRGIGMREPGRVSDKDAKAAIGNAIEVATKKANAIKETVVKAKDEHKTAATAVDPKILDNMRPFINKQFSQCETMTNRLFEQIEEVERLLKEGVPKAEITAKLEDMGLIREWSKVSIDLQLKMINQATTAGARGFFNPVPEVPLGEAAAPTFVMNVLDFNPVIPNPNEVN